MMRIEPRPEMTKAMLISVPILSAIASLVIAALPIAFAGADILQAYREMFNGVFGSVFAISEMLTRATPLMFTGLAAALAFRARLWNIGAEGQLYLGALMAVTVGTGYLDLPPLMLTPVIILMAALAGAVGMAVPTFLKIRFGADEVVTTLLLNFVILIFVQMMLEGALKDPMGLGWPQSSPIVEEAMLPTLLPRMRVHSGLILALVCAGIAQFMSEVVGLKGYLTSDLSPGFGYIGIVVAMLAGLSPAGVVLAALFIASVFVGADSMSRAMGVSSYLADLIVALSLLSVLIGGFFTRFRVIWSTSNRRQSP